MSISLDSLPNEFLLPFSIPLSLVNISHLCQINQRFNKLICNNNYFWQQKFYHDYGQIVESSDDWKSLYLSFLNVWSFGHNYEGRLGLNRNIKTQNVPFNFNGIKVKFIATYKHSAFIDLDDNVWLFGDNERGQLGLGSDLRAMIPVKEINLLYYPQLKLNI